MPLTALGLILVAAGMHAGWNLVLKQAKEKQLFLWWALMAGALCFMLVPLLSEPMPLRAWPYIVSSAVAEAVYYAALTWAYDIDDFSLIYPVARGSAPALLVLWTALFLGETPRPAGLLGIALLVLGLIIVGVGSTWKQISSTTFSVKGILVALLTATCISIYSAIDGAAVRFVSPAPYTILVIGLSALFYAPIIRFRYSSRAIFSEWRSNWLRIIGVGLVILLTYILVLYAYSLARVSYAGAVREVSVIFAAFAGWYWLKEKFGGWRIVGSLFIFLGIVVIAVLG